MSLRFRLPAAIASSAALVELTSLIILWGSDQRAVLIHRMTVGYDAFGMQGQPNLIEFFVGSLFGIADQPFTSLLMGPVISIFLSVVFLGLYLTGGARQRGITIATGSLFWSLALLWIATQYLQLQHSAGDELRLALISFALRPGALLIGFLVGAVASVQMQRNAEHP